MDTNNKDSVVNSNTQQKAMYEEKETFQKTSDAKTPTFITNNRTPSPKDRSPKPPTSLFHPLQHTHRTSMHTPKAIKKYLSIKHSMVIKRYDGNLNLDLLSTEQ